MLKMCDSPLDKSSKTFDRVFEKKKTDTIQSVFHILVKES